MTFDIKQSNKVNCFKYEFSLTLEKTGIYKYNGKTITKKYLIPKTQINKVFKNTYSFGCNKRKDLKYMDFLVQDFKIKVSEKLENIYIDAETNLNIFISRSNNFESWLKDAKVTIKDC